MKAKNCPKCGWANLADARFCGACRDRLEVASHPAVAHSGPATARRPARYSPATAALLNAVPFPVGLGYVYLGRWWRVAGSLAARVGAFVAGVVFFLVYILSHMDGGGSEAVAWAALLGPQLAVLALTVWDAWRIAGDPDDGSTSRRSRRRAPAPARRPPFSSVEMEVATGWRG